MLPIIPAIIRFIFWKVILIKVRVQYRKEHIFLNIEKSINLEVIYEV